jgi:hypothetical protein
MPTYLVTFQDTSTHTVIAATPEDAKAHILVLDRGNLDPSVKGKVVIGEPQKIKD